MKTEPSVGKPTLAKVLAEEYGLPAERLDFWPSYWASYCYIVHCINGERYFLKLTPADYHCSILSDPEFYLPLTYELHARGLLPHISYPLPRRDGRFLRRVEGYHLILFNYIEGPVLGFGKWPEGILKRVGGLVGTLHHSISQVTLPSPLQDRFDLAFEPALLRALDLLKNIGAADRQGKQALRDLILPREAEIRKLLTRLKELRLQAIAANPPLVYCHADLHGGNIIQDPQDNLYILDWEGAVIAPPERDLFFFAAHDEFWRVFLPAYERQFGPVQLSSAVFGFYFYHRTLEDLTDWIARILHHNTTAENDADDLNGILIDSLPGWSTLEKNIQFVEERLKERRSHTKQVPQ